ncbi:hypothetical protein EON79_03310 [bacterium]|nr:MAG: hypothetical protein EON79_03310 [bacterium]
MFRRLYWVTEQMEADGRSAVTGVYTSIPDLLRHGLHWGDDAHGLRVTLTKLDSEKEPLGVWSPPDYEGLAEALQPYVRTDEMAPEHVDALLNRLRSRIVPA